MRCGRVLHQPKKYYNDIINDENMFQEWNTWGWARQGGRDHCQPNIEHSAKSSSSSRAHFHFVSLVLLNRWVRRGIWMQVIAIGMPPSLQGKTLILCRFLPVCWFIWPFKIDRFSLQWVCFHFIHTYNQPRPCRFFRQYTTHIPISHPGYVPLSTTPTLPMTL